jgi:hypothetical protein
MGQVRFYFVVKKSIVQQRWPVRRASDISRQETVWAKRYVSVHPLTPELNPSTQRCLTRFFTGDFAS